MKKAIVYIIIVGMLVFLTACTGKQEDIALSEGSSASSNSEEIQISISSSSESIIGIVTDIVKTMNITIMNNIETKLTSEQQKELQELLNIENWQEQESPQRGIIEDFILANDAGESIIFYEKGNIGMNHPEKDAGISYKFPKEDFEKLMEFVTRVRDQGIKNGNEILIKQIHEFNSLIIGEPTELYDIKQQDIYNLNEERRKELHSLLKVQEWKVYTGPWQDIKSDEDIPFTLHKLLYNEDMLLQVKQYGELYIAKSRSYAGPTGEDYIFEIPKEIYLDLIDFKDRVLHS